MSSVPAQPTSQPTTPDYSLVKVEPRNSSPRYTPFRYIATRPFPSGTRIFFEDALLSELPTREELQGDELLKYLRKGWPKEYNWLRGDNLDRFETLQGLPEYINPDLLTAIEAELGQQRTTEVVKWATLFVANCWSGWISDEASYMSHSCVPNVECRVNEDEPEDQIDIVAIRDIKVGEELTCSQRIDRTKSRDERRKTLWARWGIDCKCTACEVESENRQTQEGSNA